MRKQDLARVVFRALRAVLYPTRGGRRRPLPGSIRRLLVVNRLRIGDSVVTTPFLAHVRAHLPGAEITLLVQPPIEELFLNDPRVDVLVAKPLRGPLAVVRGKWAPGFDAAVILDPTPKSGWIARRARSRWVAGYDSHGRGIFLDAALPAPSYWNRPLSEYRDHNPTKLLHQTEAWMRLAESLGLPPAEPQPYLALSDADRSWARERLTAVPGDGPPVVLHPGSDASYLWPVDRWAALAEGLAAQGGGRLFLTGGPGDKELAAGIQAASKAPILSLAGGTSLGRMAALIAEARILVSVDTCATHMASAVGTPCVALFGAGDPDIWRPYGEGHVVLRTQADLDCLGCKQARCALVAAGGRHECMEGIPVDRVLASALELLARPRPVPVP